MAEQSREGAHSPSLLSLLRRPSSAAHVRVPPSALPADPFLTVIQAHMSVRTRSSWEKPARAGNCGADGVWGTDGPLDARPQGRRCSGDPCASPGLGPLLPCSRPLLPGRRRKEHPAETEKQTALALHFRAACQGNAEWDGPATDAHTLLTVPQSWGSPGLPNSDPPNSQAS